MICPLCKNTNIHQREDVAQFLNCSHCGTVFKNPYHFLDLEQEKERYLLHENNVEDPNYQQFVAPIVTAVTQSFPPSSLGLDFGAGTGPVISKLLGDKGYIMKLWDPFFHPDASVLHETYDFIVCCEVIEHFHRPQKEFRLMHKLLRPKGMLFCMSETLPEDSEFSSWYYKNDPTHVVFYSEKNLKWIQEQLNFKNLEINGKLIVLTKG
ncbi:class I SAM-dependent methyltransferase [Aureisphaera galaxeae]|uniref:class I SAM-dependent methyltransferase n=1 Tax=Aureisphaera galaxeae TaxID=1538023 RepID=UPI0023510150|nr:class I SAM-dependent methyltransferase [Aureisphaera galaxeae]MDC8003449.1 class I SAM-dependent methyltransferase [Aureisphaera galaxeae]